MAGWDKSRPRLSTARTRPVSQQASRQVVPVGKVIWIRKDGDPRELLLVAYVQTAGGARFTMVGWPFRPFTAADDKGRQLPGRLPRLACSGRASAASGPAARDPLARPHHGPRRPPTRIDLDPHGPAPDVTVTRKATSPGELLLDVIAARILTSATAFPQDNPEQLANAKAELRVFAAGPGDIIAALLAADALPRPARRAVRQRGYQRPRHHRTARR
jgi:hypothetical protein